MKTFRMIQNANTSEGYKIGIMRTNHFGATRTALISKRWAANSISKAQL
jgi:hypothetical protein